jgi:2',3'-cyclic-nucleotide 2'-phosphodiesterase (5'-nucleotidase family)
MMRIRFFSVILAVALFFSCHGVYRPSAMQWNNYRVSAVQNTDTAMLRLLQPYGDSIHATMNAVIATVAEPLEKKQPESSLGSVFADAMLQMAREKFNAPVDAAFINNGGLRINGLPAGDLTVGRVYEVMPFDNIIVLQQVSGAVLKQLLNHIAGRGGWPMAGLQFKIETAGNIKTATDILINGAPLDENKTYAIANSDYIANGGDDCIMLKKIPQQNKNILLRDAFLEYFTRMGAAGRPVTAPAGKRVSNRP